MASYLVDKSAFARMPKPEVAARLTPLIEAGEVALCGIVQLEILFSAISYSDLKTIRGDLDVALIWVPTLDQDFQRAADVMALLSKAGGHRSAALPDLLLSAVAERAALTILHYDKDFDSIAKVTGQRAEWVVPQGSQP